LAAPDELSNGQASPGRFVSGIARLLPGPFAAAISSPGWQDEEKAT